ncbi:unnamed protein product [Calypogeia fissa]
MNSARPQWNNKEQRRSLHPEPYHRLHEDPYEYSNGIHDVVDLPPVRVPRAIREVGKGKLFTHKVVLTFEGPAHPTQVHEWVAAFNKDSVIKLALHEQLINSLYVVLVAVDVILDAKQALINASPIKALERFASVNDYVAGFDPKQPLKFKQLITVIICEGDPAYEEFLEYIVAPVGSLIRASIASGTEHHRITALIETTKKTFPAKIPFEIDEDVIVQIVFDYFAPHLRCFRCFSYDHPALVCPSQQGLPGYNPVVAAAATNRPFELGHLAGGTHLPAPRRLDAVAFKEYEHEKLLKKVCDNRRSKDVFPSVAEADVATSSLKTQRTSSKQQPQTSANSVDSVQKKKGKGKKKKVPSPPPSWAPKPTSDPNTATHLGDKQSKPSSIDASKESLNPAAHFVFNSAAESSQPSHSARKRRRASVGNSPASNKDLGDPGLSSSEILSSLEENVVINLDSGANLPTSQGGANEFSPPVLQPPGAELPGSSGQDQNIFAEPIITD